MSAQHRYWNISLCNAQNPKDSVTRAKWFTHMYRQRYHNVSRKIQAHTTYIFSKLLSTLVYQKGGPLFFGEFPLICLLLR